MSRIKKPPKPKIAAQRPPPVRNMNIYGDFQLVSITRGRMTDGHNFRCQNCDRPIKNIVEVRDVHNGRHWFIGIDCADTLTRLSPSPEYVRDRADYLKEIKEKYYKKPK